MRARWLVLAVALAGCSKPSAPNSDKTELPVAPPPQSSVIPTEAQIGVPLYPNAKATGGKATKDLVDVQSVTRDSIDQVVSFYKGNISNAVATGDKNESLIEFKKDGAAYSIELHRSQSEGVTLISINARR
jgi:hypothetical protein